MSSLPFEPYPKVSESPAEWSLTVAERRRIDRLTWVVAEKIHGAHFAFLSDGRALCCAKRKAVLAPGESFFAHDRLVDRHGEAVRALAARLRAERRGVTSITVHGELFGGGYPHPDVVPVPGVQPVQTGVWYCPDVAFETFDIAVTDGDGVRRFLDLDEAAERAHEVGLPFMTERFRGGFGEALDQPFRFATALPTRFGLPAIEGNLAEGIVIKPSVAIEVETRKGLARPMLKRKLETFAEDVRFHEARKWVVEQRATGGVPALDLLEHRACELLEANRYAAARSKLGPVEPDDRFGRSALRKLLVEDVLDDLALENPDAMGALDGSEVEFLRDLIADSAEALIGQVLGPVMARER